MLECWGLAASFPAVFTCLLIDHAFAVFTYHVIDHAFAVFTACGDAMCRVYDTKTGDLLRQCPGHSSTVTAVQVIIAWHAPHPTHSSHAPSRPVLHLSFSHWHF